MILGAQDSPSSRIMPRFLTNDEGNTVISPTVTDRAVIPQDEEEN